MKGDAAKQEREREGAKRKLPRRGSTQESAANLDMIRASPAIMGRLFVVTRVC